MSRARQRVLNLQCVPAQGAQYNSGADQRIIKMQDMPVDPMDPPKFRHKKARTPAALTREADPPPSHTTLTACR